MTEKMTAVKRFVINLFTNFGHARDWMETRQQYLDHLSKWYLREDQWVAALSRLIADFKELPSLSDIYEYLKNQQAITAKGGGKFWLFSTIDGYRKCARIEKQDGVWIYAKWECHDREGKIVVLQPNVGKIVRPPKNAEDIHIEPENASDPEPEDLAKNKQEIMEIFASNWTGSKAKLPIMLKNIAGPAQTFDGLEPIDSIIAKLAHGAITQESVQDPPY
jgi:hypothetical protein